MKTIQTCNKPTVNIKINDVQLSMLIKVLSSAQICFDKENDEYLSNDNFLCELNASEYNALQAFIK
jgi:hypothetical protein